MVKDQLSIAVVFLPLSCLACGDSDDSAPREQEEWLTELEYSFTGTAEEGVLFNWAALQVDPYSDRVFVLDPMETQVSAWRPDGSLIFVVGRQGEGPGEFTQPSRIYFADDGFTVREGWGTRFTHYTADGVLLDTEFGVTTALSYDDAPVGFESPTGNGGYVARPLFSASRRTGLFGNPPIEREPLLLVRRVETGQWGTPEPIFWKNTRNELHAVLWGDQGGGRFGAQYFGDGDLTAFAHGKILVMRRAGGPPGSLDLLELNAQGDTLWKRHLQFEPLRLTPEWIQEATDILMGPEFEVPWMSAAEHLAAFEKTLYKPEYMPAAERFFLSVSDEVWLRTFERVDSLRVHYAIPRGDTTGTLRRVLLPEALRAQDATATHVWGIRDDALDVPYVVGRRLMPAKGS